MWITQLMHWITQQNGSTEFESMSSSFNDPLRFFLETVDPSMLLESSRDSDRLNGMISLNPV